MSDIEARRQDARNAIAGSVGVLNVLAQLANPEFAVITAALSPGLQEWMVNRFTARMNHFSRISVDASRLSEREFLEQIAGSDELINLASKAGRIAAEADFKAKIGALGRALGEAVEDEARIDEKRLFLIAVRELEVPHIRLLKLLATDSSHIQLRANTNEQSKYCRRLRSTHRAARAKRSGNRSHCRLKRHRCTRRRGSA